MVEILILKKVSKTFPGAKTQAVQEVALTVQRCELLGLIGQSGSGKTTLLRLIAGFEMPSSGEVHIAGRAVVSNRVYLPPEQRGIGMVFQDYALFPHLTVQENIAFGLGRWRRSERRARILEMLELTGLQQHAKRYPHELSGGEQQRVALARALAPKPALILLDEPFSNLDEMLKAHMRLEIRRIIKQTDTTAIFVTHDAKDALAISDRVAILKNGVIQQVDTPEDIYTRPRNSYVANFFGKANIFKATVANGGLQTPIGPIALPAPPQDCVELHVVIRPEDFVVVERCDGSVSADVKEIIYHGKQKELLLSAIQTGQEFVVTVDGSVSVKVNDHIHVKPDAGKIHVMRQDLSTAQLQHKRGRRPL